MILGIDPSISCTGYCLLERSGEHGRIIEAGKVSPTSRQTTLGERARQIVCDLNELVREAMDKAGLDTVIVETPQTVTRGKRGLRSAATLPSYGVAVGAILAGLDVPDGVERIEVSATDWTRGMPTTARDPDKVNRVLLVERMYGLEPGSLGARTVAGNVADAILLARYALVRWRVEVKA